MASHQPGVPKRVAQRCRLLDGVVLMRLASANHPCSMLERWMIAAWAGFLPHDSLGLPLPNYRRYRCLPKKLRSVSHRQGRGGLLTTVNPGVRATLFTCVGELTGLNK